MYQHMIADLSKAIDNSRESYDFWPGANNR